MTMFYTFKVLTPVGGLLIKSGNWGTDFVGISYEGNISREQSSRIAILIHILYLTRV